MNFYAPQYRTSLLFNSYYYREERRRFVDWAVGRLEAAGRDPAALSFLEVGAGTGEIVELLSRRGCRRLTALDIAERMQEEARRRRIPELRLVHGSIEDHDFGDERFDVVVASFTVHHMFDPADFFRLCDRVLRARGWFLVLDYNGASWTHGTAAAGPIRWLAAPFRRLLKIKNRAALSKTPAVPPLFNHAHRLMRYEDFVAAIPDLSDYRLESYTRGAMLPAFNYALVEESAVDRVLYRALDAVDWIAQPFRRGNLLGLAGERVDHPAAVR